MAFPYPIPYFDAVGPLDSLDFGFDFSAWLELGDSIISAVVTTSPALSVANTINDATMVQTWLSGGSIGVSYTVTASIVTAQNRVAARSRILPVTNR